MTYTVHDVLNGVSGSASANYPNTAQLEQQVAAEEGNTYSWTRYLTIFGIGKLGYCQAMSLQTFYWPISLHTTYWGPPPVVTEYPGYVNCAYTKLACTSGTPTCTKPVPAADVSFTMGGCPNYIWAMYLEWNNTCEFAVVGDAGNSGGACS
jgi:hypothetical protein